MSNTLLHKIEADVTSIGGISLHVQSFDLRVSVNAIPSITLEVSPSYGATEQALLSDTSIYRPTIYDFSEFYEKMFMQKESGATATIGLHVHSDSAHDYSVDAVDDDEVTLADWILTDVGMSARTSSSAPSVILVFSHPAYVLTRTGMIYETIGASENKQNELLNGSVSEVASGVAKNGTVAILDEVYRIYGDDSLMSYLKIPPLQYGGTSDRERKIVSSFRRSMADNLPGSFLTSGSNTRVFLQSRVPDTARKSLVLGIARRILPKNGALQASTWDRILQSVCPMLLLSVVPTYSSKTLELSPMEPYKGSFDRPFKIDISETSSLDVAPVDPDPVIGTAVMNGEGDDGDTVYGENAREDTDGQRASAFYFPDSVSEGKTPSGSIRELGSHALIDELTSDQAQTADTSHGENSLGGITAAMTGVQRADMYADYAKAMFMSVYRANCMASISTVPMFHDSDGRIICPGGLVHVVGDDGTTVLSGYLTSLDISCSKSGNAQATFALSYTQPPGGTGHVAEGTPNPCYA